MPKYEIEICGRVLETDAATVNDAMDLAITTGVAMGGLNAKAMPEPLVQQRCRCGKHASKIKEDGETIWYCIFCRKQLMVTKKLAYNETDDGFRARWVG